MKKKMKSVRVNAAAKSAAETKRPETKREALYSLLRSNLDLHVDVPARAAHRITGIGAKTFEAVFEEPFEHTKAKALRTNQLGKPSRPARTVAGTEFFVNSNVRNDKFDVAPHTVKSKHPEYAYQPVVKKAAKSPLAGAKVRKVVAIPDTHLPVHDPRALSAVFSFVEDFKPDTIVILGDWFDFDAVSRWTPIDLDQFTTMEEIVTGTRALEQLRLAAGPAAEIIFLEGNHEERIDTYIIQNCREMWGITDLYRLAQMERLNIKFVPTENQPLQYGDVGFIHGHYTQKYHAAKHLDVYRGNVVYGHLHDIQRFSAHSSGKQPITSLSLGCLAARSPKYLKGKPHNWMHAVGVFYFNPDGSYTDHVLPILEGEFIFNGTVYKGLE